MTVEPTQNQHMKRLFIVDPSLKDIRGHHYMMTREATRSAQRLGFEVVWLCAAGFSGALDSENATLAPVFRATTYDAYIKQKEVAAKPSFLQRLWRRFTGSSSSSATTAMEAGFYNDLKSAMTAWDMSAEDRVLLHTGDGESLPAVARIIQETPNDALPVFHVATPYDPVGVMPHQRNIEGYVETLQALNAAGKLECKLFLYAENAYLAEHLSALWPANVRPLPIPASAPAPDTYEAARSRLTEKLGLTPKSFVVVSLGSARLEKGFQRIPAIAEHVFARAAAEDEVTFVLHASPQIVGRDPKIAEAIEQLKARPEGQVHLLLEPLSDDDYHDLLLASDVVLLPYGESEYRVRGSAVVTEALAAGKTIVATTNTYPGRAAEDNGGLTATTPADFANAILKVYGNRADFISTAKAESEKFVAANSMETYWRRCLDAEREAGLAAV